MKFLLAGLLSCLGLLVLLMALGALLPRRHRATRSAHYRQPPAVLYAVMRDFAAAPRWRTGLKAVESLPASEGRTRYREDTGRRSIPYLLLTDHPGESFVTQIDDDRLPFGGTWTYEVRTDAGGAVVRLTEDGDIRNPLFRFLARFAFGYARTMDTYLRDLGRNFGESVTPGP